MSIVRSPRKETNFYVLDKRISEDKRLSWAARGLLIYLLGKPDNWNVSVEALQSETASCTKPTRRDGVYSLINELIAVGYVKREKKRVSGVLLGYEYMVSEEASAINETPSTDEPYTAAPSTVDPTLISNEVKQELKENKSAGRPASRTRKKSDEILFSSWVEDCKEKGEKLIPVDDTIWEDKIPKPFLHLAWKAFSEDMETKAKKAKDWRAQFRTYVRKDYLKLWAMNREGQYYLTTAGKQAAIRFGMEDLLSE